MSGQAFAEFRAAVLDDVALQVRLRDPATPTDVERFVARVVEAGNERGFQISAADVAAAMADNRRAWLERWLR